jgi:hypothetical protein
VHRGFRGIELGDGGLFLAGLALILEEGRPLHHQLGGVMFGHHLGDPGLNHLKFGNRLAELGSLILSPPFAI